MNRQPTKTLHENTFVATSFVRLKLTGTDLVVPLNRVTYRLLKHQSINDYQETPQRYSFGCCFPFTETSLNSYHSWYWPAWFISSPWPISHWSEYKTDHRELGNLHDQHCTMRYYFWRFTKGIYAKTEIQIKWTLVNFVHDCYHAQRLTRDGHVSGGIDVINL